MVLLLLTMLVFVLLLHPPAAVDSFVAEVLWDGLFADLSDRLKANQVRFIKLKTAEVGRKVNDSARRQNLSNHVKHLDVSLLNVPVFFSAFTV